MPISSGLFLGYSMCPDYSACNPSMTFIWCASSSVILFKLLLSVVLVFSYRQLEPVLIHIGEYNQIFTKVSLSSMCYLVYILAREGETFSKQEQLFVASLLSMVISWDWVFSKSLKCNCEICRVILPHPSVQNLCFSCSSCWV